MTAPPRLDTPTQAPGQGWAAFYESLDRLVHDHLASSSELLRQAMALPEVTDREGGQLRTSLEASIEAEHVRTAVLLTEVKAQIADSQRLVASLATSIARLTTDLHRLDRRLDDALRSTADARDVPSLLLAAPDEPGVDPASDLSSDGATAEQPDPRPRVVA